MVQSRPIHISGYDRAADDLYSTPDWVTRCLLSQIVLDGPVWEPCCGEGAIARVITGAGHSVVATDLADHGFGTPGVDFFSCHEFPAGCRVLVTNPPYGEGGPDRRTTNVSLAMLRFVRHALDLTARANGQLALLVRFQWIAGKRAAALITSGPLDTVIALTRRIQWFDRGALTNTSQHHHAWLVFDYRRDLLSPPARIVFSNPQSLHANSDRNYRAGKILTHCAHRRHRGAHRMRTQERHRADHERQHSVRNRQGRRHRRRDGARR